MNFFIAVLQRIIPNLIRRGVIAEVNHAKYQVRVRTGSNLTDWLPYPAEIGKNYRSWHPLRVGTPVVLGCEGGELSQAVILQILNNTHLRPPSTDPAIDRVQFNDGTLVEYLSGSNPTLRIVCSGDVSLTANGNLSLTASAITINGPVSQTGGDITSEGIGLQGHHHISAKPGDPTSTSQP